MRCILGALGAVLVVPLLVQICTAGEPVWCHRVDRGDTLAAIARRHRVSAPGLRGLNRLRRSAPLRVGRILVLPTAFDLRRREIALSRPALRATAHRLRRESRAATTDRLSRMLDTAMIRRFYKAGLLVSIPAETPTYYVEGMRSSFRLARPWTKHFIEQLASAFQEIFGQRLRITSLTRTRLTQLALRRTNPNAAPARGPVQSAHLTGAAVDISKRSLPAAELAWLRTVLWRLRRKGLIHAVEEFREPHFHVMVRRRYSEYGRILSSPIVFGGC